MYTFGFSNLLVLIFTKFIATNSRNKNVHFYFSDAVVAQVLDELGLQLTDQLSGLPQATGSLSIAGSKQPVATAAGAGGEDASGGGGNLPDADADLQARLENLRRE